MDATGGKRGEQQTADEEHACCKVVEGKLALPYQYFAGRVGSRFIISLRDGKRILGVRCDACGRVFVPPRQTCERCFSDLSEKWVELSDTGEIVNFTVVRYEDRHLPRKPPFVLALIRLRGADTPMAHIVEGVAPENVRIGMNVRAVFADKTTNCILDIDHFEPV
ncbi:MAG: Zn-ribbon domain-containing OB-fold protein [bacterium]